MKIAVAGGFGFLGSHITAGLRAMGHQVLPFSRRSGVDIRDLGQVSRFLRGERPEWLVNCAAHVGGIAYNDIAPIEVYEDNLLIGLNLVKACHEAGVQKIVNIMPNCTYPGVAQIYREEEWWEGEMHETVVTYGMPRKALWVQCWAYKKKFDLTTIHLVLPNLYGPGDHFDPLRSHAMGALIKKVVEAKLNGLATVEIWGTGNPVREWMYVEDAADLIIRVAQVYDELEIINLGAGEGYTIREISEIIRNAVDWNGRFVFDLQRPNGAPRKILAVSKMTRLLGPVRPTPIGEGIRKTVHWYMANKIHSGVG